MMSEHEDFLVKVKITYPGFARGGESNLVHPIGFRVSLISNVDKDADF